MNCPDWVEVTINAVVARKRSRETWQQWVNSNGRLMVAADSWSGIYQGEISQMDDNYLLQTVGEDFVIHDRLLLQPDYSIGQARSISYFEGVN